MQLARPERVRTPGPGVFASVSDLVALRSAGERIVIIR